MPGPLRESVITLAGGPWDRQTFYLSYWEDQRQAALNMGRSGEEFCGARWVWTAGEGWPKHQAARQAA